MKVKIFESNMNFKINRTSLDELESQVAEWLDENASIKGVDIKQSAAGVGGVQCSYSYQSGTSQPPSRSQNSDASTGWF